MFDQTMNKEQENQFTHNKFTAKIVSPAVLLAKFRINHLEGDSIIPSYNISK